MADEDLELQEMRCRACGTFMGYRRRIGRFVFWCSEACGESHLAKWQESQIRDETIVELFLQGQTVTEISRLLGDWPYQYVQQTLARRGLNTAVHKALAQREGERAVAAETATRRRILVRPDRRAS